MFRVYDSERERWVAEDVYLSSSDELVIIKQIMGLVKSPIVLDKSRYICHQSIGLQDVNGEEVFEGDYLLCKIDENKSVIGLVTFAEELSAYIVLVEETNEFYTLGSEVAELIQIIGNVFDGFGDEKYS